MKKTIGLFALILAFGSCQKTDFAPDMETVQAFTRFQLTKGITEYSVDFEGNNRKYTINVPLNYQRRKTYPLVLVLKGKKGTAERLVESMNSLVNQQQYIAVYAEPITNAGWNIGVNEEDPQADVRFIESIIATLTSSGNIKTDKIYCLGFSYGASMAHYLALNTAVFAAIAPVSGSLYQGISTAAFSPVSVLQIHGEQDNSVPYNGGYSHGYVFYSVPATMSIWADNNGCNADPVLDTSIPGAEVYRYNSCGDGKEVILFNVPGSGHDVFSEFNSINLFSYVFDFFNSQSL